MLFSFFLCLLIFLDPSHPYFCPLSGHHAFYCNYHGAKNKKYYRDHQRNIHAGSRKQYFICAEPLDHCSSQTIARQISQKYLSLEYFFAKQHHKHQKHKQTPETFIEKQGLYQNPGTTVHGLKLFTHSRGDLSCPYRSQRQLHGKNVVCIFPERFSVKKASPLSYYLPDQKSHAGKICHLPEGFLSDPAVDRTTQHTTQKSAIKHKSSGPYIQKLSRIIFIKAPGKSRIKQPCPCHTGKQRYDGQIQICIRIFMISSGFQYHKKDSQKHSYRDQDAIDRDLKVKDLKGSRHMIQNQI